jgi:uncharacterized protein GlcG (DUF336 family)
MRWLAILLAVAPLWAQPELKTKVRGGVVRAVLLHVDTSRPVTDEEPARPNERLTGYLRSAGAETMIFVDAEEVPVFVERPVIQRRASLRARSRGRLVWRHADTFQTVQEAPWQQFDFTVPASAGGSFVDVALSDEHGRTGTATFPVSQEVEDPSQLTAGDVSSLISRAVLAVDDNRMAIAVVDRAGRPLGVFRKPQASESDVEAALSLARTSAFFSHDMAPLSSRTVQTISRENFPNNVPNQPAAALFGIENTNRGCYLSDAYASGKTIPPATNLAGDGPGNGITTQPGSIPVYKAGKMVGGIGVGGVEPNVAEFASVASVDGQTLSFVPVFPLPPPGAVFIDGIRLPFVEQTTQPAGTQPAAALQGAYVVGPRAGAVAADGWLVPPAGSATLSAAEVESIVTAAAARAELTRAIIRLPLGSRSRMVIAVSDLQGNILGIFRMPDATIFSIDVAASKARNVIYFASAARVPSDLPDVPLGTAVTNRTIGFGAQSFFPTGIAGSAPGPFRELFLFDSANPCTQGREPAHRNQSGIVFFPGSAPLYRNGVLVGGLGVSGDGVEQDDYVTAGGVPGFESPPEKRADRVFVEGVRLPYWRFPRNPEQ